MDNKQEAKYIERIEIKGLWGRYDVDWKLNPDVSILVGENGTGKSTILDTVFRCFKFQVTKKNLNSIFKGVKLSYMINNEKKNHSPYVYDGTVTYGENHTTESGYSLETIPEADQFLLNFISTFDTISIIKDTEKSFFPELNTEIDFFLNRGISSYKDYQLNLSNRIFNQKQDFNSVFEKKKYFFKTVNRLFAVTGKVIDEENNGILFKIDNLKINPYQLSAGEKQLLILLLTVLCQDEKPSILLMDEPEISLHLRWQYELIEIIRTLNPNCQVIITTHSPSIFGKGWRDKVFFIDTIVHPMKKEEMV